ncbi:MAG: nucleoside-diphosphate sugar epimerase/dehydratase [Planctomycetota bacterium]
MTPGDRSTRRPGGPRDPRFRETSASAPRRRGPNTLVVGTAMTVRQLLPALSLIDPPPAVVGCLLPRPAILPLAVLGGFDQLETTASRPEVQQVLVSLPAVMETTTRRMAETLDRLGVAWRYLPPLADQLAGATTTVRRLGSPGQVDPSRLIDRRPRPLDDDAIGRALAGKTVLITGAGGSIGSELALAAAGYGPARLVLVERGENALFEIDRQVAQRFPRLRREAVLHDVTQAGPTRRLLDRLRPDAVFHAAAHKHVPMMESHPAEAVENNFHGTRAVADAAHDAGCERFVMISTDKAVNPSSVMGATKRLAELYIQHLNRQSDTRFCMVRFGNVLGSACSLIPIWTDQLARGGPITVTHRDMTRYFMTIPEAAGLVLQAGAYTGRAFAAEPGQAGETSGGDSGGEVFLLDMGEPIRILDLADRFLRQQGFVPDEDVPIEITGPRPGEKLFEELAYSGEDMLPTPHASIRRWRTTPPDAAQMQQILATLERLRGGGVTAETVAATLRSLLPEMVRAAA